MSKLLLIDGNNVMFRAYHATAALGNLMKNSKGLYTNMLYGFTNILFLLLKKDYTHVLVAFDKGKQTIRHKEYEDYKGTRKPIPEELIVQIPYLFKLLDDLNVNHLSLTDYEADDIIGCACKKYKNEFEEIHIVSNDFDLMQLIDEKTFQLVSKKSDIILFDSNKVKEIHGVYPNQVPDFKALVGDTSDNIKGIAGVGEKTAITLIEEYSDLDNIYAHVDDLKGKLQEKIKNGKDDAYFSKKLATIITDFDLNLIVDDLKIKPYNQSKLLDLLKELEFHSLIRKMDFSEIKDEEFNFKIIKDVYDFDDILLDDSAIVLEIFGDNYHTAEKLGFGLTNKKGNFFIPYDLIYSSIDLQVFLSNKNIKKRVYNYKQMAASLMWDGFDIDGINFDLLLAGYLINPELTKDSFRILAQSFNNSSVNYEEEIYGKGAKYHLPDLNIYAMHAAKKANTINKIYEKVYEKLKENNQLSLFKDIEIPLSKTLAKMEVEGIRVDKEYLKTFKISLENELATLEEKICELAGKKFNIQSPKQLGDVLFNDLNLDTGKKTKTGFSTSQDVLESLIDVHPIISLVLRYRMIAKLYSTYALGIESAMNIKNDGKVHTIYNQTLTNTGRLSSVEPNLQNIPIRYEEGRAFRKTFIAEYDSILLAADYSQIELRVLASMANEENMIHAFLSGEDIHKATAKIILHKDEVTSDERRKAKSVNFGIIYGMSAWGLSEDIKISPKEAEFFIKDYNEHFPEIKKFMDEQIDFAKEHGYVKTIFDRRRYIPEINSKNYMQKEFAKRTAMNAPIQGSAADIIKIAMVKLDKKIDELMLKSRIILQIHDELVLNVKQDELQVMEKILKETMEEAVKLRVPLLVSMNSGKNLFETKW